MCHSCAGIEVLHAATSFTEPYSLKIPKSPFVGCTILALRSRPLEPCAHSGGAIADRLFLGSWRNRNAPLSCRRGSKSHYLRAVQTRSDRRPEKRCNGPRRDETSPFCRRNEADLLLGGFSPVLGKRRPPSLRDRESFSGPCPFGDARVIEFRDIPAP